MSTPGHPQSGSPHPQGYPPHQQGTPGPQALYQPPRQQPPRRGRAGAVLAGFLVGLVAAALVGGVLVWTGVARFGADPPSAGPDTTPITMPETLGGLRTQLAVQTDLIQNEENLARATTRLENMRTLTAQAYSEAHGGVAAGVEAYSDDGLEFLPVVIAFRAESSKLVAGNPVVTDPADLGFEVNMFEVVTEGEVRCQLVRTRMVAQGGEVDPEDERYPLCQRTGPGFTVLVTGTGDLSAGPAGRARMVALTNAAWDALAPAPQEG